MLSPGEAYVPVGLCAEDVEVVLRGSAWGTVRGLHAVVQDGVVTLTGYVRRYYDKQVAFQQVQCIPGVTHINDLVEVYWE